MPKELVFTSAPSGLKSGTSGYCTVARHEDMSPLLEKELERISFFEFVSGHNPVIHSYRSLALRTGNFFVLSCIRFTGSDHTGRTNYLAHHLAFEEAELYQQTGVSPADYFRQTSRWLPEWPTGQTPKFIGEGETIVPNQGKPTALAGESNWTNLTGAPLNAYFPKYADGQMSRFLVPSDQHESMLNLMSEFASQDEVGSLAWRTFTFTTFLQKSDNPADFKCVGGAPGTAVDMVDRDTLFLDQGPAACFQAKGTAAPGQLVPQHQPKAAAPTYEESVVEEPVAYQPEAEPAAAPAAAAAPQHTAQAWAGPQISRAKPAGPALAPVVVEEEKSNWLLWTLGGLGLVGALVAAILIILEPWAGEEGHSDVAGAAGSGKTEEAKTETAKTETAKTTEPKEGDNPNKGSNSGSGTNAGSETNPGKGETSNAPKVAYQSFKDRPERRILVFVEPGKKFIRVEEEETKTMLASRKVLVRAVFSKAGDPFSYPKDLEQGKEAKDAVAGSSDNTSFTLAADFANGNRGVMLALASSENAKPSLLAAFVPTNAVSSPLELSSDYLGKGANVLFEGEGLKLHSNTYESKVHKLDGSNAGPLNMLIIDFRNQMQLANQLSYLDTFRPHVQYFRENPDRKEWFEVVEKKFLVTFKGKDNAPHWTLKPEWVKLFTSEGAREALGKGIQGDSLKTVSDSKLSDLGFSSKRVDQAFLKFLMEPVHGDEAGYKVLQLHASIEKRKNEGIPVFGKRDGIFLPKPDLSGLKKVVADFKVQCQDLSEANVKKYSTDGHTDTLRVASTINAFDKYLNLDNWFKRQEGAIWGGQDYLCLYLAHAINAEAKKQGLKFSILQPSDKRMRRLSVFCPYALLFDSFQIDPAAETKKVQELQNKHNKKRGGERSKAIGEDLKAWRTGQVKVKKPGLVNGFKQALNELKSFDEYLPDDPTYKFYAYYTEPFSADTQFRRSPNMFYRKIQKAGKARTDAQKKFEQFVKGLENKNKAVSNIEKTLQNITDWELRINRKTVVKFK